MLWKFGMILVSLRFMIYLTHTSPNLAYYCSAYHKGKKEDSAKIDPPVRVLNNQLTNFSERCQLLPAGDERARSWYTVTLAVDPSFTYYCLCERRKVWLRYLNILKINCIYTYLCMPNPWIHSFFLHKSIMKMNHYITQFHTFMVPPHYCTGRACPGLQKTSQNVSYKMTILVFGGVMVHQILQKVNRSLSFSPK